jgi:predicted metal-dependent hydrolase
MNNITIRQPDFGLSAGFAKDWLGGDAFRSQILNALSMMFPIGEQYFIDSLHRVAANVDDSELRQDIRHFIAQESIHRRLHGQFNQVLAGHGLRNSVEHSIRWRIGHAGWQQPLDHLAMTAAYEHFTAILGESVLRNDIWLRGAPANLKALWMWHAVEEVEHKSVVLATYYRMQGGEFRRCAWFIHTSLIFAFEILYQLLNNLIRIGEFWQWRTWAKGVSFMFGRHGMVWITMRDWFRYLRPHYLPRKGPAEQRAARWLADNPQWFLSGKNGKPG